MKREEEGRKLLKIEKREKQNYKKIKKNKICKSKKIASLKKLK